jgi:hypothetical protein
MHPVWLHREHKNPEAKASGFSFTAFTKKSKIGNQKSILCQIQNQCAAAQDERSHSLLDAPAHPH